jgi:hypothetical protein
MEHLSAERDAFAHNLDALKASCSSSAKKVHASTNTDYQFVDSSNADLQSCTSADSYVFNRGKQPVNYSRRCI